MSIPLSLYAADAGRTRSGGTSGAARRNLTGRDSHRPLNAECEQWLQAPRIPETRYSVRHRAFHRQSGIAIAVK